MVHRAMISQPMRGKSSAHIQKVREKAKKILTSQGYEVVESYFHGDNVPTKSEKVVNNGLFYLAKSLELMSECEAVYFCKGFSNSRGCMIEHEAALQYGLNMIYEK